MQVFPTYNNQLKNVKATPAEAMPGSPPLSYIYNYVFNYTDHLGNVRLSYSKDPQTGVLEILDETHYYPFGLKHEVYVSADKKEFDLLIGGGIDGGIGEVALKEVLKTEYLYKYNGKEWQDELNLNLYDYHARNYDPAIGRWMNPDPLAEKFMDASPYNYALNNPIFFIDPDGMEATVNVGYDREVAFDSFSGSVQASYFDNLTPSEDNSSSNKDKLAALQNKVGQIMQKSSQNPENGDPKPWDSNSDGKLQKTEADLWGVKHGTDITVDNSKIDWTGLKIPKNSKDGDMFSLSTTQAFLKLPYETAATYGGTRFKIISVEKRIVEVIDQSYHYEMRPNNSFENIIRNTATKIGYPTTMELYNGKFKSYMIHYENPQIQLKK